MRKAVRSHRLLRIAGALLGVTALVPLATSAPAAAAAAASEGLAACAATPTTKAFLTFGDLSDYSLIPNGGLESGAAGWALHRAEVEPGNESFFLNAASDAHALRVEPGGRAVSPRFCVGAEHPTFRFVMRPPGGQDAPDLKVSIRYVEESGEVKDQQIATVASTSPAGWRPSPVFDLFARLGLSNPTATTTARLLLEVERDGAPWRIDDVFVDPYARG